MGVAGSGKSTVGIALAELLGAVYIDGDDLHSDASVAKMSAGQPLTDQDRAPWLVRVGETLHAARGPVLIGCSALKRRYRDTIRAHAGGPVAFVHLSGNRDVIASRMSGREGHFMPVNLIDSQFAALEPLGPDEAGFAVDIDQPLQSLVDEAARTLEGEPGWERTSR
jgi:gluconokinase